jgi:hypothetical protein
LNICTIYILLSSLRDLPQNGSILGHKACLYKYKKIDIIPCILSDHNALKLEINNKNSSKKHANNWKLNTTLLNDEWVIDEIKDKIKRLLEVNENENTTYQSLLDTSKAVLRGPKIIYFPSYADFRSRANAAMWLDLDHTTRGKSSYRRYRNR